MCIKFHIIYFFITIYDILGPTKKRKCGRPHLSKQKLETMHTQLRLPNNQTPISLHENMRNFEMYTKLPWDQSAIIKRFTNENLQIFKFHIKC